MAEKKKIGTGKSLVLTFDDGPEPVDALNAILNTLSKNSIRAEFYLRGDEVKRNPNLAKTIASQGHTIQNHSWSHVNLERASERNVRKELTDTQDIIQQSTGITPAKIRPPYGAGGWPKQFDPELAKVAGELSLRIENWDIDTEDWKAPAGLGPKKMVNIKEQLSKSRKNRLIVLMHVLPTTANDLSAFIEQAITWGFSFATPS